VVVSVICFCCFKLYLVLPKQNLGWSCNIIWLNYNNSPTWKMTETSKPFGDDSPNHLPIIPVTSRPEVMVKFIIIHPDTYSPKFRKITIESIVYYRYYMILLWSDFTTVYFFFCSCYLSRCPMRLRCWVRLGPTSLSTMPPRQMVPHSEVDF